MRNRILIFILFLLLISSNISCQQPKLEKVKIASGGHIVHFLPLDIAVAKGFFTDEGLDPEITQLNGGTATAQALIAEQVDFSLNSIDHAFKAAVQGKDNLRMIVLLNQTPGMVLVVNSRLREKVKNIADLKGMTLGVTSKGSATHMVLASLLSKSGVNPDNVNIINAGSATFPPALENGQIAGGIALEPFASFLVEQGKAFILADLNTLKDTERFFGGPYNQAGVMTRQDMIERRPDLVQKIVNIHVRALKWIQAHTPQEIADALPIEVVGTDKVRYVKTLEKLREFYSHDGIVKPQGVENVYNSMKASGSLPSNNTLKLEQFYTNTFVNKAHTSASSNLQLKLQTSFAQSKIWWNKLEQFYSNTFVNEVQASVSSNPQEKLKASYSPIPSSPEKTDSQSNRWLNGIDWRDQVCGLIFGIILTGGGGYFFYRLERERTKVEEEKRIAELERLNKERIVEIQRLNDEKIEEIRKAGLSQLPPDLEVDTGLDVFENKICELAKDAKKSIQLCLATPLLHSLKDTWVKYNATQICQHGSDHWALKFCEELYTLLRKHTEAGTKLKLELLYLEEKAMEQFIQIVPEERIPFVEYKESIEYFITVLERNCQLIPLKIPEVPLYLAIIDGPNEDSTIPSTAKGIVGFMSTSELMAQRRMGRTAKEIAANLPAYRFSNPEVVRFFSRLYKEISLHGDQQLLQFLQHCRRNDYMWALIANGVYPEGPTTPYATLLHPKSTWTNNTKDIVKTKIES